YSVAKFSELKDNPAAANVLDRQTQLLEKAERQFDTGVVDPIKDWKPSQFQALLGKDEAFVDIQTYHNSKDGTLHYGAFVLRSPESESTIAFIDLGKVDSINADFSDWRARGIYNSHSRNISMDTGADSNQGEAQRNQESWPSLVKELYLPIVQSLPPSTTRLWICEDGELSRLPWGMFTIDDSSRKSLLLCHVDSPRELVILRQAKNSDEASKLPILLVGGITYKNPALTLQGAAEEIDELQSLAGANGIKAVVMTKLQPAKEPVLEEIPQSSIVHFATHGFFEETGRALAQTGQGTSRALPSSSTEGMALAAARNPLIRSGILLAPAKDDINGEAKLTAEELVGVDMRNCSLVTLSACDTGRGEEVTGQGVIGLRSAIMAAGAKSVLMSLWPVDDDATRALMRNLYTNLWQKKMNKAEALKQAQIAVRDDADHPKWRQPAYWAGWTLVGEGWKGGQ
ncbi:MAG: CHAT domain-containing protein, partial [Terriglobales bacterium]